MTEHQTGQPPAPGQPYPPPPAGWSQPWPAPYPPPVAPPPRRSWARRHWKALAITAGVLVTLGVIGAVDDGGQPAGKTIASPSSAASDTSAPTAAPSAADTGEVVTEEPTTDPPEGPAAGVFGQESEVDVDGNPGAGLTVGKPALDKSFNGGFTTPTRGQFVSFKVTFVAEPGVNFDYNPFDFYVRDAAGAHFDPTPVKEPTLAGGTLNSRERVTGWVTFDAPRHGALVYAPNLGGTSVAEWRF